MHRSRALPQSEVIRPLNPILRGWAHYDRLGVSTAVYARLDALTGAKLRSWARRRHPTTTTPWVIPRSWHRLGTRLTGATSATAPHAGPLQPQSEGPSTRHSKVRDTRSPYDGDWVSWSTRQGRHPEVSPRLATLLKQQRGRCASCGLCFHAADRIASDPSDGDRRHARGTNLQALHGHCHDAKTREHGDSLPHGMRDQPQDTEERSARKRARSVLAQREAEQSASRL